MTRRNIVVGSIIHCVQLVTHCCCLFTRRRQGRGREVLSCCVDKNVPRIFRHGKTCMKYTSWYLEVDHNHYPLAAFRR